MSAQPQATFSAFSHFCSDGGNKLSCEEGEGDKIACTLAQITQFPILYFLSVCRNSLLLSLINSPHPQLHRQPTYQPARHLLSSNSSTNQNAKTSLPLCSGTSPACKYQNPLDPTESKHLQHSSQSSAPNFNTISCHLCQ